MKSMDASLRILAGVAILLPPLMTGCAAQTPVAPRLPVPTVTLVLPTDRPLAFGSLGRDIQRKLQNRLDVEVRNEEIRIVTAEYDCPHGFVTTHPAAESQ